MSANFPVSVKIVVKPAATEDEILAWGETVFGPHREEWNIVYIVEVLRIMDVPRCVIYGKFKTEQDAAYFSLKWSV